MDKKIAQSAGVCKNLRTHTCSLLLSLLSIFAFVSPSFSSGISSNANSASCDNSTLEKYTGTSNLTAGWTGNHIDLYWYADSEATTPMTVASESQDCTYGGSLTPPANIPSKPGYTFTGWRARQASCSLSGLYTTIRATWDADHIAWQPINGSNGYTVAEAITEEELGPGTDRSSGLSNGEWMITFSYGTIKGMAKCSAKSGNNDNYEWSSDSSNWTATESEITSAGDGEFCWCKATKYTPSGGNQCSIATNSWVLRGDMTRNCIYDCAYSCAAELSSESAFRRAVFRVSQ